MLPYDKRLISRARHLRKKMTPAETFLWSKLKNKQIGYCFYHQKPVGIFIVDFYCYHAKLAVEVDGGHHLSKQVIKYDQERSEYFTSISVKTIRFTNKEVLTDINQVLEKIKRELE
jgi:very-short-patch-repair endonuclease